MEGKVLGKNKVKIECKFHKKNFHWKLRGCLDLVFSITHHSVSSLITQNWCAPWLFGLFGFVFSFCFHHSILWFLSDELWKLKTTFRCIWVMKTKLWRHFGKYTHIWGTHSQRVVKSGQTFCSLQHALSYFFFFFFPFMLGLVFFFFFFLLFFPFHIGFLGLVSFFSFFFLFFSVHFH